MLEFKVNEFLILKLENGITNIYIKGKKFIQCKRLVINILKQEIPRYDEIDSIDEAAEEYGLTLWQNRMVEGPMAKPSSFQNDTITPEQEFWGHCSNIQTWYEHDYDTRLLHSSLAFPLLKVLVDVGDINAKKMLKTEIMERLESGHPNVVRSILSAGLLDYLSSEERRQIIQLNVSIMLSHLESILKFYPNLFLYVFKEKLIDYLNPKEKTQLLQTNYQAILTFSQKISGFYPKIFLEILEIIPQDGMGKVELKQLIQKNFSVILKDIEKIWKEIEKLWNDHPNILLHFFDDKLLNYLINEEEMEIVKQNYSEMIKKRKEKKDFILENFSGILTYLEEITAEFKINQISEPTISFVYAIIIDDIKETKLLDDFFNTIAKSYQFIIFIVMLKAIRSIKTSADNQNDMWKKWLDVCKVWMERRRKEFEEWREREKKRRERTRKLRIREVYSGPKIHSMWFGIQSIEEVYNWKNTGKFGIALKLFEATNNYKIKNRKRINKRQISSPYSFQSFCRKKEEAIKAMNIPLQEQQKLIKNNTYKWFSEWQRDKRMRDK